MQQSLVFAPEKILSQPAKRVGKIDKKVRKIISDMKDTLINARNPRGVGLAAVQIGIPLQIFVMKPPEEESITVCINPEITWYSKELSKEKGNSKSRPKGSTQLEGCLSIKNVWGQVKRSKKVRLSYMNETGKKHEKEFTGFSAHIVQHEVDHLSGTLFTQRVLEQNGKLFRVEIDENGEETLKEFKI